jgi:hypothetical protein
VDFSGNRVILTTDELKLIAEKVTEDVESVVVTRLPFMHEVEYWLIDGTSQRFIIPIEGANGSQGGTEKVH